jgi:hypothetical protein
LLLLCERIVRRSSDPSNGVLGIFKHRPGSTMSTVLGTVK